MSRVNDFVGALFKAVQSHDCQVVYPLKRSFGRTLESCDIRTVLAYAQMTTEQERDKDKREAEFLVAGLLTSTEKMDDGIKATANRITYQKLLARLLSDVPQSEKNIERLLNENVGADGVFSSLFSRLHKRAVNYLYQNEQIDYKRLLDDLRAWNNSKRIRVNWALDITATPKNSDKVNVQTTESEE